MRVGKSSPKYDNHRYQGRVSRQGCLPYDTLQISASALCRPRCMVQHRCHDHAGGKRSLFPPRPKHIALSETVGNPPLVWIDVPARTCLSPTVAHASAAPRSDTARQSSKRSAERRSINAATSDIHQREELPTLSDFGNVLLWMSR